MNKIIIKGRLTRDPEMKTGANGVEFCRFTVAVDRRISKETMKDQEADFFDCTAFGKDAATISAYMTKGREILVEGRMESRHTGKDGQKRTFWGLIEEKFYFCGNKGDSGPASVPDAAPTPVDPPEELPF